MGHGDMEARLSAAAEAHREQQAVTARHDELLRRVAEADAQVLELSQAHELEARDVARLEGMTLTRVVAALWGTRDDAIARERAEADAAAYRLASARADTDALRRELDGVAVRLAALHDAPARYAAALDEKQRLLAETGDPRARQLLELAEQRGVAEAEVKEIAEARRAAASATEALAELGRLLDIAAESSVSDMLVGGIFTSLFKHQELDEAAAAAALADQRVAALNAELADVSGRGTAAALVIGELTRFADVWLDNIFTDFAVHDRIKKAQARVEECDKQVARIGGLLAERHKFASERLSIITARRERALLGS
ncbi:hypothetical protein [Catellatospora chokoriensis]|nr:hypothetical protein [Catellatospora chokoriensis]